MGVSGNYSCPSLNNTNITEYFCGIEQFNTSIETFVDLAPCPPYWSEPNLFWTVADQKGLDIDVVSQIASRCGLVFVPPTAAQLVDGEGSCPKECVIITVACVFGILLILLLVLLCIKLYR